MLAQPDVCQRIHVWEVFPRCLNSQTLRYGWMSPFRTA
jgi:hypothetical protein